METTALDGNTDQIAVQATNVTKQVSMEGQTLTILDSISLGIVKGETVAITGASGSGKTSLLGILAGLDTPSSGAVDLIGNELTTLSEDQRAEVRRAKVGFVFQSFHLLPNLTAVENVALALEVSGAQKITKKSLAALEQVGLLGHRQHLPSQMSGGEQQRVALARALVTNPEVLFADEPTGNLDHHTSSQICDLLFDLCKNQGTTLVLVTHDPSLAKRCDRQCVIDSGRLL